MDWFKTWFDTPYYHILYKNHDVAEAEQFLDKLTARLQLEQGAKVIDLACGRGRHSVYLNRLGYEVLGLDLSANSIAHNRQFAGEHLDFAVHDMRNPIQAAPVDAVFNLFTSFGYFTSEEDDRRVFASVNGALKKGGYFVLDFLNQDYLRAHLVPSETVEREGIQFIISKKIEDDFIVKNIRFRAEGQDFNFTERVKLHTLEGIQKYAKDFNLEPVEVWGDYELNGYDSMTSPRCINLFRKV